MVKGKASCGGGGGDGDPKRLSVLLTMISHLFCEISWQRSRLDRAEVRYVVVVGTVCPLYVRYYQLQRFCPLSRSYHRMTDKR